VRGTAILVPRAYLRWGRASTHPSRHRCLSPLPCSMPPPIGPPRSSAAAGRSPDSLHRATAGAGRRRRELLRDEPHLSSRRPPLEDLWNAAVHGRPSLPSWPSARRRIPATTVRPQRRWVSLRVRLVLLHLFHISPMPLVVRITGTTDARNCSRWPAVSPHLSAGGALWCRLELRDVKPKVRHQSSTSLLC
jgi:hypothetical protein